MTASHGYPFSFEPDDPDSRTNEGIPASLNRPGVRSLDRGAPQRGPIRGGGDAVEPIRQQQLQDGDRERVECEEQTERQW